MSSDQRPGKVRVFSSRTAEAPPARRRGDPQQTGTPPAAEPAALPTPMAKAASPYRTVLPAALFLFGCATGGAVVAWLGLMPGAPS